jgi:hypothetical protein
MLLGDSFLEGPINLLLLSLFLSVLSCAVNDEPRAREYCSHGIVQQGVVTAPNACTAPEGTAVGSCKPVLCEAGAMQSLPSRQRSSHDYHCLSDDITDRTRPSFQGYEGHVAASTL